MRPNKYRNLFKGLIASILLVVIVLLLFYPSQGVPGNLFVITYLIHVIALLLGVILFLLRLFRLASLPAMLEQIIDPVNNPQKFIYIFIGCVNLVLGITALVLYFIGKVNSNMMADFWPHLVLAAVLLLDSLIISKEKNQSYV
jgi:hypothetical protein